MHRLLENALDRNRTGVSWLIEGGSETRIRREANAYLQKLFCESGTGCGVCDGCRKYTSGVHADLRVISGTKIDEVRGLSEFAAKHAREGSVKAILIPRVDLLTEQAQNAILKTVEEPPEDTVVVLGALSVDAVLPTILSRCTVIEAAPDGKDAEARIAKDAGVNPGQAKTLAAAAGGDYEAAIKLNENGFLKVRDNAAQAMHRLIHAKNRATSRIEKLLNSEDGKLDLALEAAILYLQDVALVHFGLGHDRCVNTDIQSQIEVDSRASARAVVVSIERLHELIEKMRVCKGLNKKLALQGTLLGILEDIV